MEREKKEEYARKIVDQLEEWEGQIEKLKAAAAQSQAEISAAYNEQAESIQAKAQAARQKLAELRGAGDEAWQDLKGGLDSALKALGEAVRAATSRFK